jgi:hypothetical protein
VENDSTNAPALVGTFVRNLELPSGGWVVLRDPLELRGKDRRAVQRAVMDPDRKIAAALDLVDGTICMLVESWSLPYLPGAAIPRTDPDLLGELTIADQTALEQAVEPAIAVLFPREVTIDDAGVPGSPTRPASA